MMGYGMKLRWIETVKLYKADNDFYYRYLLPEGFWEQVKVLDEDPAWSGNIPDEVIEQLDEAMRLESF